MSSFCSMLLDRGAATLQQLDACAINQALHGGDFGTNLIQLGALKENALQRLLSDFHELPVGPQGKLEPPDENLSQLLPKEMARRYRVFPIKRTRRTLHVATSGPLEPDAEKELRNAVGLQLRPVLVTPLRLAEALWRYGDLPPTAQIKAIIEQLAGRQHAASESRTSAAMTAPYRRMSERPDGIRPSIRQPAGGQGAKRESVPPQTLDGIGPRSARPTPPPPSLSRLTPPPLSSSETSPLSSSETLPLSSSETLPPLTESAAQGPRPPMRDTSPWTDSPDSIEEAPLSIGSEFSHSLPPPGGGESNDDGHTFRHRGPFTIRQAELAANQAREVQTILEVVARFARQYFERTMLFTVHGERAELRMGHAVPGNMSSFRVDLANPSLFRRAFEDCHAIVDGLGHDGVDAVLRSQLGLGDTAAPVALVPLSIRGRVVALLWGDDGSPGVDRDAVLAMTAFVESAAAEIARIILTAKKS